MMRKEEREGSKRDKEREEKKMKEEDERMAKSHGREDGGWKRRLPDTATARIRPGRLEEYRGYTRRYGRPRGGVNAIKRASIRPSRRTSLISQSLLGLSSPSRVLLLLSPAALPPILSVDFAPFPS
jgi:hypothetical protein